MRSTFSTTDVMPKMLFLVIVNPFPENQYVHNLEDIQRQKLLPRLSSLPQRQAIAHKVEISMNGYNIRASDYQIPRPPNIHDHHPPYLVHRAP